jgi:hypothetical protein
VLRFLLESFNRGEAIGQLFKLGDGQRGAASAYDFFGAQFDERKKVMARKHLFRILFGVACFAIPFLVVLAGRTSLWAEPVIAPPPPPKCNKQLPATPLICSANPQVCASYADKPTCNANTGDYNAVQLNTTCAASLNNTDYCGDFSLICTQKYSCSWGLLGPCGKGKALLDGNGNPVYTYVTKKSTSSCTL